MKSVRLYYRHPGPGETVLPIFPVYVSNVNDAEKRTQTDVLIDSGATVSVFNAIHGEQIGIDIKSGEEHRPKGISGSLRGWIHEVDLSMVAKTSIKARLPVIFSYEFEFPYGLLGRAGFFSRYKILFDDVHRFVEIEEYPRKGFR